MNIPHTRDMNMPDRVPSQVFPGLNLGASLCFPLALPTKKATVSLTKVQDTTKTIQKNPISFRLLLSRESAINLFSPIFLINTA